LRVRQALIKPATREKKWDGSLGKFVSGRKKSEKKYMWKAEGTRKKNFVGSSHEKKRGKEIELTSLGALELTKEGKKEKAF